MSGAIAEKKVFTDEDPVAQVTQTLLTEFTMGYSNMLVYVNLWLTLNAFNFSIYLEFTL